MNRDDLEAALGTPVDGLVRLSGGASRETWAFRSGERDLIVQCERPGGVRTGGGMAAEATVLRLASEGGVGVPALVASGDDGSALGARFIVSERVVGETIPRKLLRDDEFAGARAVLARQAGAAVARIHSLPVEPLRDALDDTDQLEQFREILDGFDEPHPAFELGFRWLERHRPAKRQAAVVHGDFRNGNLVVGPEGLRAVLDWELAHIGDPVEDLGWFCVRAWRFGSPHRAGGFGSLDDFLDGYRQQSGVEVDPEDVRWWEAMGTLKWGVMCMIQVATHLNGLSRSVELAAIGRRTAENEWDLLELIR